ncbi:MAG: LTA synthase family protein [Aristaeellaceae bacterium]
MILIFLVLLPMLLVNLVSAAVSRRRPSAPFALMQGLLSCAACILVCALVLIPLDRAQFYSANGILQFTASNTVILLCTALPTALGLLFGLVLQEEPVPGPFRRRHPVAGGAALALFFALLLLSQAYLWGQMCYDSVTFSELVFYLNMPLTGTANGFVRSVLFSVVLPAVLAFLPVLALCVLSVHTPREVIVMRRIHLPLFPHRLPLLPTFAVLLVWLAVLLNAADSMLGIRAYIRSSLSTSTFIEENYVSPEDVSIVFPEQKRNLITIYIESCETVSQDVESGGSLPVNLIPELTQLARENTSFSRNTRITGAAVPRSAAWTIAGLVAQTAGLPLLNIANEGTNVTELLPGAVTMGDLLRDEGYRLVFMAGSDFTFGGRRAYFTTHGGYEIWDLLYAHETGVLPEDYHTYWGFEDMKLYAYAKDELLELAQGDQPFHFAMLTVDTHNPGYRCPLCPTDYQDAGADSLNYADTLRCASAQLAEFVAWCQQQPFYENTTIVVTGDHEGKQEYFYRNILNDEHADANIEHYVYNAWINSVAEPVSTQNRLFTTLDYFPTVLASIGVSIDGDRLGLGTNLFSDTPTLSEQYGEDLVLAELEKKSVFYDEHLFYRQD